MMYGSSIVEIKPTLVSSVKYNKNGLFRVAGKGWISTNNRQDRPNVQFQCSCDVHLMLGLIIVV